MSGNDERKCISMMVTVFGTAVTSLRGGTKGVCMHVSTPTLKSVMELRNIV